MARRRHAEPPATDFMEALMQAGFGTVRRLGKHASLERWDTFTVYRLPSQEVVPEVVAHVFLPAREAGDLHALFRDPPRSSVYVLPTRVFFSMRARVRSHHFPQAPSDPPAGGTD